MRRAYTLLAITACRAGASDYTGTTFLCDVAADCPSGQVCSQGYCRAPDAECVPGWWDCAFSARRKLTFDNAGEALPGFPLPVFLDAARVDYSATLGGGEDLRFVDPDGAVLPHEIELWDEQAVSIAWIRVPQIDATSAADFVWLYHGNADAVDGQNAAAVWDASYAAVWHMQRDPGGATPHAEDSTTNANDGVSQGAMTSSDLVAGKIARGVSFDGVDDGIQVAASASLDITATTLTLSAWVNVSAVLPDDTGIIIKSDQVSTTEYNYQLGVQAERVANFRVRTAPGAAGLTYLDGVSVLSLDRWYYLTGVFDGVNARIYVDGVQDGIDPRTGSILSTVEPLYLGRRTTNDNRFFNGVIDEARVQTVARTPGWIVAEHRAGLDMMIMYGADERLPITE